MDVYGETGDNWPTWAKHTRKTVDALHRTVNHLFEEIFTLLKQNKRTDILQAIIDVGRSELFQLQTFVDSLGTEFYIGENAERVTRMAQHNLEAIKNGIYNLYSYGSHRWITPREENFHYIHIIPNISQLAHSCLCGECGHLSFSGKSDETTLMDLASETDVSLALASQEHDDIRSQSNYEEHPPFQFSLPPDMSDLSWFDENSSIEQISQALDFMDIDVEEDEEYEDVAVTMSLENYYSAVKMIEPSTDESHECCICLEKCCTRCPNKWRSVIVETACGHVFHNVCLQRLCCETGPPKCPICRHDIREKLMIGENEKAEKETND